MKRFLIGLLLLVPALAWGADRCVSDIGTRTTGACASTCGSTDFATAANCYNSAAQGSSSVTTALTQSTTDGDTITIDDGIHAITTNILASSMTGPNPGTVTIRCRTATRGSCGFTQSSATAANFSLGNNSIAVAFVLQNIACTKSAAHTSTTTAACFHNVGTANGNVTYDSVYMYGITYNVGTATTGSLINMSSASNKTVTIQGTSLVSNITVNGTASVPAAIAILNGTNDLVVTGLTVTGVTATDAQSMIQCADDCDLSGVTFSNLAITDTDAQWHGVIDATDTALSAAISGVTVTNSTFNISSSDSIGAILGKFQGPATIASSGCTGNTVRLISGTVSTPIGPCWISAGANGAVVTTDGVVTGNTAPIGLCGYANQGGSLTQYRLNCTGNTFGQGLVYCGGWGACNLYSSIVASNTQDNTGEGSEGGVFLCQLQSTATAARTCTIYNSTLASNTLLSAATGSVYFRNNDTDGCAGVACVNTLLITNSVIRNGKAQEIVPVVTSGTDVLTVATSNLTDKDDPTPAVTGGGAVTETLTGLQEGDPVFVGTCGSTLAGQGVGACRPLPLSPLRRAGTYLSIPRTDFRNCRFNKPPTIGAFEVCAGDMN